MRPASRAVHAGRDLGARSPLAPDLSPAAVHVFTDLDDYDAVARGERAGHYYGRNSNANREMLERAVAELEGAEAGVATASGMAALHAVLPVTPMPIAASREAYGGTLAMLKQDFEPSGYRVELLDLNDLRAVEHAMPSVIIAETITNPLCRVVDLRALAELAREIDAFLIVDNTFATPVYCRPLEFGAHVVVHSATKYLGGHSDLVAGVVVGSKSLVDNIRARVSRKGATLGPFDAWLALRGIRTLDVRMRRHSENALTLAKAMKSMPGVRHVHHPLLEPSPTYAIAKRILPDGTGGMMAFDLEGDRPAVQRMIKRFSLVTFAASLGGVETTISYPELTSHRSMPLGERVELGIGPGTVRVSVGLEDPEDIVADFTQAVAP
jgi:cystathionine beta-lyase/cystathionine gamma-synthase